MCLTIYKNKLNRTFTFKKNKIVTNLMQSFKEFLFSIYKHLVLKQKEKDINNIPHLISIVENSFVSCKTQKKKSDRERWD